MLPFVATPPAVLEAVLIARQEVRARTVDGQKDALSIDEETAPSGTLQVRTRTVRAWITYLPRLTVRDLNIDPSFLALHNVTVGVMKTFPRAVLTLTQDVSYGTQNFTGAPIPTSTLTTLPQLSTLPPAQTLGTMAIQTSLSGSYVLTRRLRLGTFLGYSSAGGATDEAVALLPRIYGPSASAETDYAISRRQGLLTRAAFQRIHSSLGSESTIVTLAGGWRYAVGRRTSASLSAGVGFATTRERPQAEEKSAFLPTVSASITHKATPSRTSARYTAMASLTPAFDRLTGNVDQRVDGSLTGSWPLAPRTTLDLIGGAGRTLGTLGNPPITVILGSASVGYFPERWVRFDAGVRGSNQVIGGATTPGTSQLSGFVAVTVSDTERLLP